jgi:murein L,D-transpeptidase YcbB/YkuD
VTRLAEWLDASADDGLPLPASKAAAVRSALVEGNPMTIDQVATAAAVTLLNAHRTGCCNFSLRSNWHIATAPWPDAQAAVAEAVERNQIDQLFGTTRPSHPFYYDLRHAYSLEKDPGKRATLAANLDRWRWMPRNLGQRYIIVNAAAFEASLWENRRMVGRWKVIVGKQKSQTPIFAARVTGVTFNPWWEIPPSIVAESIGALVRTHPAEAAQKGYVVQDGRYRQKPGPSNALGRMKLVMANPYNVYLHDTPSQGLFDWNVRAFSHGCVRVGDAIDLATTLLAKEPGWDKERVDALIASKETRTITLARAIPIYIAYFTAEPDGQDGVRYFPDIYGRDRRAAGPLGTLECGS